MTNSAALIWTIVAAFLLTTAVWGVGILLVFRGMRQRDKMRALTEEKQALEKKQASDRKKLEDDARAKRAADAQAAAEASRRRSLDATMRRYETLDTRAGISALRETTAKLIAVFEKFLLGMKLNGDNRYTVSMTPEDLLTAQQAITHARRTMDQPRPGADLVGDGLQNPGGRHAAKPPPEG